MSLVLRSMTCLLKIQIIVSAFTILLIATAQRQPGKNLAENSDKSRSVKKDKVEYPCEKPSNTKSFRNLATTAKNIPPVGVSNAPSEFPTGPMDLMETKEFEITRARRPNCRLILGAASGTTYKVMKKQETKSGKLYTNFFAVHSSHFTPNPNPEEFKVPETQYLHQAGYAQCHHGWINTVAVNARSNGLPFAGECGIGTVLTSLCFFDPDVNKNVDGNAARQRALGNPVASKLVEKDCKELVGLQMNAKPKDGAYAYFSAAKITGYNKLMILDLGLRMAVYDTVIAKKQYDTKTGFIKPCCNTPFTCIAFDGLWYFCAEK